MKLQLVIAILCFLFSHVSFSQVPFSKHENKDLQRKSIVYEIVVEESSIRAISRNFFDTITVDKSNTVLYCHPDSSPSFWYKVYVYEDCKITFEIFPSGEDNIYNYFLYKSKGDISIADIKVKNIYPVRTNFYKNEMSETGTGLSQSSVMNYTDTSTKVRRAQLYYTAYHDAIPVKKGEVLLLNIYHINGIDCGPRFILKTNKQSQFFHSLYKTCYAGRYVQAGVKRSISLSPSMQKKSAEALSKVEVNNDASWGNTSPQAQVEPKVTYMVWDSIKHTVLPAEIVWIKKTKGINGSEKGKGEMALEKNVVYDVSISSVGYKNKKVVLSMNDSSRSFTRYVFLTPVKEGEEFVMDKIYFHPNTYCMRPGSLSELSKLLVYLKSNPEVKIEIQGHTSGNNKIRSDYEGEGSFNGSSKKLSQYRADIIKKYLVDNGIDGLRLVAKGYGGNRMIYPNPKTQDQADMNIRVGVLILSKREPVFSMSTKPK